VLKISVLTVYHATLRTAAALMIVQNKNVVHRLVKTVLALISIRQYVFQFNVTLEKNGIRHHAAAKTLDSVRKPAERIKNWTKRHVNAFVL
jgi:hypothetical protein